jgi:ribosome-associated toxin RatA of RatAB toxin-antitoxin module
MTLRFLAIGVAIVGATLVGAASGQDAVISVREDGGVYAVEARFKVPEPASVARDVLTDYAGIPRFMPDVRTSQVVERQNGSVRVEQETVSKFMLFSRRVHLVLDVSEGDEVIRFRDRCARSFVRYEGAWTIRSQGAYTEITYELTAQPAFAVPDFVLRKLLNRNARVMIDRLRAEISSRAISSSSSLAPR